MSLFVGNSILAKKTVAMFCSGSRPDGEELDLPEQARPLRAGGAGEYTTIVQNSTGTSIGSPIHHWYVEEKVKNSLCSLISHRYR